MNIIDAVKSGRRFRRSRANWGFDKNEWFSLRLNPCNSDEQAALYNNADEPYGYLSVEDITAEDYELEPEPPKTVTITKDQLRDAWLYAWKHTSLWGNEFQCFEDLAKQLGLGETE